MTSRIPSRCWYGGNVWYSEARLLAALNHPGIAAIYSFEEVPGRHLLVMELAEGESLGKKIASGPLPLEECLSYARQIAAQQRRELATKRMRWRRSPRCRKRMDRGKSAATTSGESEPRVRLPSAPPHGLYP
jgi:hypothetical protein